MKRVKNNEVALKENADAKTEEKAKSAKEKAPYRTAFYYLLAFLALAMAFFVGVRFINHKKADAALRFRALDMTVTDAPTDAPPPATATADGKINVNTADAALLATLPGIGDAKAEKIIAYRAYYGRFTEEADLLKVEGIGEKTLEQIAPYITFGDTP